MSKIDFDFFDSVSINSFTLDNFWATFVFLVLGDLLLGVCLEFVDSDFSFSTEFSSGFALEEAAEAIFPLEVDDFPLFLKAAAAVFADEADSSDVAADIVFSDTFGGECCEGMLPGPIKPFLE
jgi:hypothetical protein